MLKLNILFSSAADIVSWAYPMPSRLSVCLPVNPFSNKKSPSFLSDLSDIWLECAQQYCPKSCGSRILIFFSLFFLHGSLIRNNKLKMGFSKSFYMRPWNLVVGNRQPNSDTDSKVCVTNVGPTRVLATQGGPWRPQVGPTLAPWILLSEEW